MRTEKSVQLRGSVCDRKMDSRTKPLRTSVGIFNILETVRIACSIIQFGIHQFKIGLLCVMATTDGNVYSIHIILSMVGISHIH
jgi:hypothetical protein